jgi:type IV pilus assembly protein PilF
VFENLGLTALELKRREQAKAYFQRSLRLNSRQPKALMEMAMMSYEDKAYVPARGYYESYSALVEQDARSLLLGTRLATIFEDRDKAASLGLQLKRLYPGTPEYQQYLSEQR